jgi:hypothetical protein
MSDYQLAKLDADRRACLARWGQETMPPLTQRIIQAALESPGIKLNEIKHFVVSYPSGDTFAKVLGGLVRDAKIVRIGSGYYPVKEPKPMPPLLPPNWGKQSPGDSFPSGAAVVAANETHRSAPYVHLHKSGATLGVSTNISEDTVFQSTFASALISAHEVGPEHEHEANVKGWLAGFADIICSVRGFTRELQSVRSYTVREVGMLSMGPGSIVASSDARAVRTPT